MKERFSLDYYRTFSVVYESRSFSEAARRLYVTQSAISQSVKQLEFLLDVKLFVRGKRSVIPTAEANALYSAIIPAIETIGEAEEKITRLRLLQEGSLCICAADTVAKYYLLPYLKRWNELYPNVRLTVVNRTSTEAFSLLSAGKIDIAFVNSPVTEEKFSRKTCLHLHDVFIGGSAYKALSGKTITRKQLIEYPLIMLETLSNSRRAVDAEFFSDGIILKPEIELGAHELLIDFARIGLGISCVTREFSDIRGELFEIQLDQPLPERTLELCWLENEQASSAKKKFIEMF
ncbi:MAG: LysR family transcriptional regulator [Oscillospiraceae bacterium]|nr:LysR family transcriptional regulator [Oscillospiraceae bacterium]